MACWEKAYNRQNFPKSLEFWRRSKRKAHLNSRFFHHHRAKFSNCREFTWASHIEKLIALGVIQFMDRFASSTNTILIISCIWIQICFFMRRKDSHGLNPGSNSWNKNSDIACVLPRGGPPPHNGSLHQGTTEYRVDENGKFIYLKISPVGIIWHIEKVSRIIAHETSLAFLAGTI